MNLHLSTIKSFIEIRNFTKCILTCRRSEIRTWAWKKYLDNLSFFLLPSGCGKLCCSDLSLYQNDISYTALISFYKVLTKTNINSRRNTCKKLFIYLFIDFNDIIQYMIYCKSLENEVFMNLYIWWMIYRVTQHYGSLESYFQVMSLDIMEGYWRF